MRAIVVISLCLSLVAGDYSNPRIIGGTATQISQYPSLIGLLYSSDGSYFNQFCGGSLINQYSVLTAASCTYDSDYVSWRFRAGSSYANSGGTVYSVGLIINHPNYVPLDPSADIAIIKSAIVITYVNLAVQPATFAGAAYFPLDGSPLSVVGWGVYESEEPSEQLRHAQARVINQQVCSESFEQDFIQDSVICSSNPGVGQCSQDYGSPVFHDGNVVGVTTASVSCGSDSYPTVNTRVSSYIFWIQANA